MSGPEHDPDRPDSPFLGTYDGVVTANEDPLKLGRVKLRVPGLIEPQSGWVFPDAQGAGPQLGLWFIPVVGADVKVRFLGGDPDVPLYSGGHWGKDDAPTPVRAADVTPADAPKIRVIETERHLLILDTRTGHESIQLVDKETGDGLRYDGVTRALELRGTVAVRIVATGAVSIEGLAVTINGRPVSPGGGPI